MMNDTYLYPYSSAEARAVSYTHLDVYKRQIYNCTTNKLKAKLF